MLQSYEGKYQIGLELASIYSYVISFFLFIVMSLELNIHHLA